MIKVFLKDRGLELSEEKTLITHNPIITGWSNYHQSAVSSKIFHKLDNKIWNMLWHWAKRRHPHKPKQWIVSKYWQSSGKRNWVFSGGNKQLKPLSDKKIVRHTKLKLDMNPHLDKDYFVLRKIRLGVKKFKDGGLFKIWFNKIF